MAVPTYPITGIPFSPSQTDVPTRQEITLWAGDQSNQYQVSLFLQALTQFKQLDISQRLSYFQIAGIHCYPLVGWDGEAGVKTPQEKTDPFPGYCSHNRVTFPTWHRPYMLLYEQVLYYTMVDLIDGWVKSGTLTDETEITAWRNSASQFRLPYWDWARKQPYINNFGVPQICTVNTWPIIMPGGKVEDYPNPLINFSNPTLGPDGKPLKMGDSKMGQNQIKDDPASPPATLDLPWSQCAGTSRYGILHDQPPSVWSDGINNWQASNSSLQNPYWYGGNGGSLSDAVSRMLSPRYFHSWEPFSSTRWHSSKVVKNTHFLSVEYIHNILHNVTGGLFLADSEIPKDATGYLGLGLGHMSDVPVAAFDPIFWLHHCNIDRLTAIWQALNQDKWFDRPHRADPSPSSPLLPFHYDTNKSLWDSNRGRDWTTLNYQYDDLVPQPGVPVGSPEYIANLRSNLNTLYPPVHEKALLFRGFTRANGEFDDYIINVIYDRYALGGLAYSILFFVGKPPQALSSYQGSPNFVGSIFTFSASIEGPNGGIACPNCAQQAKDKVLSKAQIPITLQLLQKAEVQQPVPGPDGDSPQLLLPGGGYGNFTPDTVEQILQHPTEGLSWIFVAIGGEVINASHFPNTEVVVLSGTGRPFNTPSVIEGDTPAFNGYTVLEKAASNQPLGLGHSDTRLQLIKNDT